ncbi:MAG: SCO family protein [Gammaproteobacteria bacterium]
MFSNKPLLIGVCLLALIAGYGVAHWQQQPSYTVTNATVLDFPRPVPTLEMTDHNGTPFSNDQLLGSWSIVFFGFTHCPDVCPTTMSMLASTKKRIVDLEPESSPQVVMISVDPARDTPEELSRYVPFFDPDFVGVTGTEAHLKALTESMGVAYRRVPTGPDDYTIDHTSALFIINPEGALQAISSSPHLPEVLANDLLALAQR